MSSNQTNIAERPPAGRGGRWKDCVAWVAGVIWLVGSAVRWSIRDASPVTGPVFYALPVPLLLVAGWWCIRRVRRSGRRRVTLVAAAVMAIQAIAWGFSVFGWNAGHEDESTRLLFWNVCRGNLGYDAIAREINAVDPDIVALGEATRQGQDSRFWKTALPGYSATCLGAGMTLLVRNRAEPVEVEIIEKGHVPGECRYRVVTLGRGKQRLGLLIADIKSSPLMFRRSAFERLDSIAARNSDLPLLVVGDFNTPLDSVHVDLLRADLTNAFESSGTGYRETWPVILPVLSLDQIWGNSGIRWHRCWRESSLRSDHRRVVAEFSIAAD